MGLVSLHVADLVDTLSGVGVGAGVLILSLFPNNFMKLNMCESNIVLSLSFTLQFNIYIIN